MLLAAAAVIKLLTAHRARIKAMSALRRAVKHRLHHRLPLFAVGGDPAELGMADQMGDFVGHGLR